MGAGSGTDDQNRLDGHVRRSVGAYGLQSSALKVLAPDSALHEFLKATATRRNPGQARTRDLYFCSGCKLDPADYLFFMRSKSAQKKSAEIIEQPEPFTPGMSKAMVRQHAFELYRDKLPDHPLTLDDWVMAEKDLANTLEAENMPK